MKNPQKNKIVIVIVGPTAIGKSAYAVSLAKKIDGEIISADSRQVYRGLDIGSGKVTEKEMAGIPHYMLDVADPKKVFSVHDFKKMALPIIEDIISRGKTPIIVGGTGLYIDALFGKVSLPEVPPNKKLRAKLSTLSTQKLFEKLKKMDPRRAKTIDAKNPVRLIRAIEIATALGKVPPIKEKKFPYPITWIGLRSPRDVIRKNIEKRLQKRIWLGMMEETDQLHKKGLSWKRLRELGLEYRYTADFLQNKLTEEEFIEVLSLKIYQYAMRQLTWWKKNKNIGWIEVHSSQHSERVA